MENYKGQGFEDIRVEAFLSGYKEEKLSEDFKRRIIREASNNNLSPIIISIKPAWKRLSLAASIAAFALGVVLSNQVFSIEQTSSISEWTFGEQGLYSYLMEDER